MALTFDLDFYRYTRKGVVVDRIYSSLNNVRAGIRYAKGVDEKYKDRWPEEYGGEIPYQIQKLVAVPVWKTFIASDGFPASYADAALEWMDVDE